MAVTKKTAKHAAPNKNVTTTKRSYNKRNTSAGARQSKNNFPEPMKEKNRIDDWVLGIILLSLGTFLVIALQLSGAGKIGDSISIGLMGLFGKAAYILPYYLILYSCLLFMGKAAKSGIKSTVFLVIFFLLISTFYSIGFIEDPTIKLTFEWIKLKFAQGITGVGGGSAGMSVALLLVKLLGKAGAYILVVALMAIALILLANKPIHWMAQKLREKKLIRQEEKANEKKINSEEQAILDELVNMPVSSKNKNSYVNKNKIMGYMKKDDDEMFGKRNEFDDSIILPHVGRPDATVPVQAIISEEKRPEVPAKKEKMKDEDIAKQVKKLEETLTDTKLDEVKVAIPGQTHEYKLPPLDILKNNVSQANIGEREDLLAKAALLEQTLQNFNVSAKVIQVSKGPAVTRYEIQPSVGVKVSSIVRLSDDIALNLEAKSIRMEAPIPGKAAVGIEVENNKINAVLLREVIDSPEYKNSKSKITFAVGKDISGNPVVANLKDMPHLLIAGSTGSGKSVCINSIIISLLYKAKPDEIKLILIDPKVVELSNYNGIPHLLIPVVNEPSKAAVALNWAVSEMNERYRKFADEGVKDLSGYNEKVKIEDKETLPQIVIIIDELADLMMAAPSQVEDAICRLAQMARAAGMHLIVATQRPSVDIITGVIKANIPSRIAFAVSSQVDSRTILDMAGAEKLVGKGDMLFSPMGMAKPIRVQGTLVSDNEVEKVIEFVKAQQHAQEFSNDLLHTIETTKLDFNEDAADELLRDAIELVVNAEQASVSMLQRRFRIGYNRAARLVDMMEERGIVGPSDGSRPRRVLLSKQGLAELDGTNIKENINNDNIVNEFQESEGIEADENA